MVLARLVIYIFHIVFKTRMSTGESDAASPAALSQQHGAEQGPGPYRSRLVILAGPTQTSLRTITVVAVVNQASQPKAAGDAWCQLVLARQSK